MSALAALDAAAIARDAAALVRVPSVTGDEFEVLDLLREQALALGLDAELRRHDLVALRADPDHPGEEAPRDELWGLRVRAGDGRRRIALCGHVDVVGPGSESWAHGGPYSGALSGGFVHGRGAVDMKGGVAAALHAIAAARDLGARVELVAVASEEDGGLGSFAALREDAAFDACVIPEPTGFDVVCAHAGAVTFTGVVEGVGAHAARRLDGISAIDRYLPVHAALAEHERALNAEVEDPWMRLLDLPYPLLVGRLAAGSWSSTVPDRLEFEGRAPVLVGEPIAAARARVEAVLAAASEHTTIAWTGGQFASALIAADSPLACAALAAVSAQTGRAATPAGVPWGADMRLWCAAGVPTVMVGPRGIARAHGVDERVAVDDLLATAAVLVRTIGALCDE